VAASYDSFSLTQRRSWRALDKPRSQNGELLLGRRLRAKQ